MEKPRPFGPDNPHPLSVLRSELVWEGKYDEYGNRRAPDITALAVPMQRIETVDEPRARSEAQGGLFDNVTAHRDDFRNRLIWGDNRLVTASLLGEFRGSVDAIYIDPPFDVGADFTMDVAIGEEAGKLAKDQSALEMVAYRDTWGKGADSYLHMMNETLVTARELLSGRGSIFVHCDWHVGHYLKLLLDDVFGRDAFRNELVWYYRRWTARANAFQNMHDVILYYCKNPAEVLFNPIEQEGREELQKRKKRGWNSNTVETAEGRIRQLLIYDREAYDAAVKDGRVNPAEWDRVVDATKTTVAPGDVLELPILNPVAEERLGYPTQKPERLIERLFEVATEEDSLVADLFCGSGTTGAVAEKMNRRWILADLGRFAVHTTRKRMIEIQRERFAVNLPYRAFDLYNLGRYERQWWQSERLRGADAEHRMVILEFFRAEAFDTPTSELIHGRKGSAVCHVDGIDSTFSRVELELVTQAALESGAKELVCLAWEFEMDLGLECARIKNETGITVRLIQIPREIMEKNRKEPPPFLEMAALTAEAIVHAEDDPRSVDIRLTSFVPSLAEVPTKELQSIKDRAVKNGFDFIDFWAVDFDFNVEEPFHHDWQDYRLRKDRSLKTESDQRFVYDSPGQYVACVKVIDVFGADTSITVPVIYD